MRESVVRGREKHLLDHALVLIHGIYVLLVLFNPAQLGAACNARTPCTSEVGGLPAHARGRRACKRCVGRCMCATLDRLSAGARLVAQSLRQLRLALHCQRRATSDYEARHTCRLARSMASWPMWLELKDETRSSMETLMMVVRGRGRRWWGRGDGTATIKRAGFQRMLNPSIHAFSHPALLFGYPRSGSAPL